MCSAIPVGVSKSTATHHWRVLRESGVIRQQQSGRATLTSLRREDLEARFPGLLGCVLDAYASECADDDRGDDRRGDDRRGDERQGESVAGLAAAHHHSVAEPLLEARSG